MVHLVLVLAFLFSLPKFNKKIPFYYYTFIILLLFLTLRYNYGNDYENYKNIHYMINKGFKAWGYNDLLFKKLVLLIKNFYIFIFFQSFFYIFSVFFLIKKNLNKNQYWLAILIWLLNPYLFLVHLSSIRQTFAICFFIFAIEFLKKEKIKYFISLIFSIGFHKSAALLFPVFLLNKKNISKYKFFLINIFLIVFLSFFFDIGVNYVLNFKYFSSYSNYFNSSLRNSLLNFIISIFIFEYFLYFLMNKKKLKGNLYLKLAVICSMFSILAFKVSMFTRIEMYFGIFILVAIPKSLERIETKNIRLLFLILFIALFFMRYIRFFNNPIWMQAYTNYKTILF